MSPWLLPLDAHDGQTLESASAMNVTPHAEHFSF